MVSDRVRNRMIQEQLVNRGIQDQQVLKAMREIPRHQFVSEALAELAYQESNLPIGEGQTLSLPYTVARMTEALTLTGEEEVLEIGTGSGYQTAVLSRLCRRVYTIERHASLGDAARRRLRTMGYHNVVYRVGDGSMGWPDPRKFDRILVTAGAPVTPESLANQLAEGGFLVVPEGSMTTQSLVRWHRGAGGMVREILGTCRFVPLVGAEGWREGRS
ncbi:MAG: protein-L-isoaspartate(D-aspartate) O-methyltransferase [Magnetococcales bacterium]|nr:protein-L-isoaspartate(D-aspartate) O-methyltransferase [Magnetococcales bacterium]NGZ27127.1 protein-L-isoaspartate(D-aspartate) O-methyltransferase [Magnetococcales bacterium]